MVTRFQLPIVVGLIFSFTTAHAKVLQVVASTVTLRMKHAPLGRFDSVGKNAIEASFLLDESDSFRLEAVPLTFRADSLISPIPLRDIHMRRHLKTAEYPYIEVLELSGSLKTKTFSGLMRVRDSKAPIEGMLKKVDAMSVEASFKSKLKDFGIEPPMFMGIGVKDDFEVLLKLEFKEEGFVEITNPVLGT